ncbi:helix-turn-helix domain-containing protein [Bacillus wiedmannii]|uniref:helix-turn-helix domain-containing protein n=1 Tax=Bacillus wiedmannii TaxID=1890302 RepID=UPI000BEC2F13|nr:helix-turn-helix transcriptional regulator [Bacillus wiedmannii]PEF32955.1 transcriptional regulator [Bacillus wiedmannii]
MDNNTFGKNIRKLRAIRGLSRREFAEAINTPYSTVTSWENGDKVPKIERLPIIAKFFNVSESHLLHHQMSDTEIFGKESGETDPIERMAQILIEKYRNVPEEHKPRIEKEILRMAQLLQIEIEMKSQHGND